MRALLTLLLALPVHPFPLFNRAAASPPRPDGDGDAAALLARIEERGDYVDPDVVRELARLRSPEALEDLFAAYERMRSVYMRRHVLRRLPLFEGLEGLEEKATAFLESVARTSAETTLRQEAVELLAAYGEAGRPSLARIVEAPGDEEVRRTALSLVVGMGRSEDRAWLERMVRRDVPRTASERRRADPAPEPIPVPESLREVAFAALVPGLDAEELRAATEDPNTAVRFLALEELDARDDESVLELAERFYESARRSGGRGAPRDSRQQLEGARLLLLSKGADFAKDLLEDAARGDAGHSFAMGVADLLAASDDPEIQQLVAKKAGKGKGQAAVLHLRAARRAPDPKLERVFERALEDKEPEVRRAARDVVVERSMRQVLPILEEELAEVEEPYEHGDLLAAVEHLGERGPEATERLVAAATDPEPTVRNVALELLGGRHDPAFLPSFAAALDDAEWSTRLTAARALAELRSKEAIGLLVARIAKEEGRMRHELADLLFLLTAQPYETAAGLWASWWEGEGGSFEIPTESEVRRAEREREERFLKQISQATKDRPDDPELRLEERPIYYGIEVISHRVVFVIDVSGSMDEMVELPDGTEARRIEVALDRLASALEGLERDAEFDILAFSGSVHSWRDGMGARERAEDMESAREFLRGLKVGGGTNLYGALQEAFDVPGVDTIFLLSDGEPSMGWRTEPGAILDAVERWNRNLGLVLHCVALGSRLPLLRDLARACSGEYVQF